MKIPTKDGTPTIVLAAAGLFFLAFCLLVQYISGAWSGGFVVFQDEPSHFVGAVMMRDWVASGHWRSPLAFAHDYYNHYPFFAVGHWPPLFTVVTGLWMLIAGVGRAQALFIPALFAAGSAFLVMQFVRQRAGFLPGVCAGILYLSLPASRFWMCAVMVDHMTAFLCLLAAAVLLRYLKQPTLANGLLFGFIAGCAMLSKYSAAYLFVLPFASVVFLRRFELFKKASLWVMPAVIAVMVGPWDLWTKKMALCCENGIPEHPDPINLHRVAAWLLQTFRMFPPPLLAVVVIGLVLLLAKPRVWREDWIVLALLYGGHLACYILAPVYLEERYLLAATAVLLIGGFFGWHAALAPIVQRGRWGHSVPALAGVLAAIFVVLQLIAAPRQPADQIRPVVAFIMNDPQRAGEKVVVPPDLEGPMIAEFVVQTSHRPDHYLLRPVKILAESDWFSMKYTAYFNSAEQVMDYFQKNPVNLIVWNQREGDQRKHAVLMDEMLRQYPAFWRKVYSQTSGSGSAPDWAVYEYSAARTQHIGAVRE